MMCARTHTHTHTHTVVTNCSTWTECWRSKRGGKFCSGAGPLRRGHMSNPHLLGGVVSLCCDSKSHKPCSHGSWCCRCCVTHHPRTPTPPCPSCQGRNSSPRWGPPGHTLTTAVLYGFLCSYNQRGQAGEGLRQLQEGMLHRTEDVQVRKKACRYTDSW